MSVEIDHIIIFVTDADAAAAKLRSIGLTEGAANVHPGQGTACRRFFFRNAYIELLFVTDEAAVRSEGVNRTGLWERWRGGAGVCPFGIAFRPGGGEPMAPPFPSWEYRPKYLPPELCIHMGENSTQLDEPLLAYLPFARRPDAPPSDKRQPLVHAAAAEELMLAIVGGPWRQPESEALNAANQCPELGLCAEAAYFLRIGFDSGGTGGVDLRPDLPVELAFGETE